MAEGRVHKLPEVVANQIAAGEVVERPASVVKELVENALDAGATRVDIAIEGGGAKSIEITDNGCGMIREDAIACLERQATSKIATSEDIVHIATFGFRGEAIPSIASISRFSLITRPASDEGATQLRVLGGTLEDVSDAGHPIGTTVTVRDLFFNVPARRKFLRAPATEFARIRQTLTAIALAHPEVAFRFRSEGRDQFQLPQGDSLLDRIRALLGDALADALLPVDSTAGDIRVHGFITKPDFIRGGTPEQYVFINARPATAPQIQYAIREAWPTKDHRPALVLFVDLPPEEVDVNVHPAKREVRFRHGNRVIDAVMEALSDALAESTAPGASRPWTLGSVGRSIPSNHVDGVGGTGVPPVPPTTADTTDGVGTPPWLSPIAPMPTPQAPKRTPRQDPLPLPEAPTNPYPILRGPAPSVAPSSVPFVPPSAPSPTGSGVSPALPHPSAPSPITRGGAATAPEGAGGEQPPELYLPAGSNLPWKWLRVAEVLPEDYWLVVTDQGLVTVDAKAALERIVYERLMAGSEPVVSQPLLLPETLQLPITDAERVTRFLDELGECGFDLSPLGNDTFLINALPAMMADLSPVALLTQIVEELDQTGVRRVGDAWRREVVARAAAKAAAGAQHPTTKEAVVQCLSQLAACGLPYATPRGRPTMILTSWRELHRRFQRG